ncbi:MAG TPA: decaprenyl-phosphate phosphoribosyltransferase [Candidatus Acidoferrales bacterium]|nr:decaprenyl-phosphate phosphoribosyltransferase [Candidatus Acidoferrales bacterium]
MKNSLRDIFRLLRPRQWIKNFAIYGALLFSGFLFDLNIFTTVTYGFIIFCALSSSIYIINDIFDIEKDRIHPFKRFRPLAHNDVSIKLAIGIAVALAIGSLFFSYILNSGFFIIALTFFVLHLSYSVFLKHIEIIDILTLAAGYMLRVFAGEVVSNTHISAWLLLTVISLSIFLAIGKRRSEIALLSHQDGALLNTRKTLTHYTDKLLDIYLSIFATSTFISYSLFTFLENPRGLQFTLTFFPADALGTYLQRKWLMVTILPVTYGLMRYLQRIYEKQEGESPERVLFSDRPLLISVVVWTVIVVILTYFIT